MAAELLENTIDNLDKEIPDLQSQFKPPYKYYNPKFNFYEANGFIVDEKGKPVKMKTEQGYQIARRETEQRTRSYVIDLIDFWQQTIHPHRIQAIKDYQLSTVDRALYLKEKKMEYLTNEKQPIIRTYVDRVVTGLFTGNYTTKAYATTQNKAKKTKSVESFTERCYAASKARKNIMDSAVDAVTIGNGYYRVGFKPSKEMLKYKKNPQDKFYNMEEYYATLGWESPFNIFAWPHRSFYDQPLVYRNFYPIRTILKEQKDYFRLGKDQLAIILASPQPFSTKNFNKVRLIKYYETLLLNNNIGYDEDKLYQVRVNNNMCEYVEYRDGENLLKFINGYMVYDYINPLPTKKHPFKVINYTRNPGVWVGDGIGTILAGSQRLYDALFNIMFDLAKFTAGPMFLLKPGQFIEGNEKVLNYEPFTFKQVMGADNAKIEVFEMPKPDQVNFKMMSDILDMANFAIAPSSYNQLPGVSRSATDAEYRYQSLRDALRPLSESMNEAFSETIKDRILLAKYNMPPKFRIPVFGLETEQMFAEITREDLAGDYIFQTEFESVKDINKTVERSQFTDFIANFQAISTDPVTGRFLYDMEKLAQYGISLFTRNEDFMLSEQDYYKLLADGQKNALAIQTQLAVLQEQAKAIVAAASPGDQNNSTPPEGVNANPTVPVEQTQPGPGSTTSEVNTNINTSEPLSASKILKGLNGG